VSRVRTCSPISDIDRMAQEEGVQSLTETGEKSRRFEAFGRVFDIAEVQPGKVGLFSIRSTPKEADDDNYASAYEGVENHDRLRLLFRRAVKWRERVA
jgi:hypothetical protein